MGNFDPKSIRDGKAWCDVVNTRKKFKLGDRVQVCDGSGLVSRKEATVIAPYYWRDATDGTYREPGPDQVPLLYDDGVKGFMYKNRLTILPPQQGASVPPSCPHGKGFRCPICYPIKRT